MITDGNGNVLAGGERGGKSHITYKPYGEILRTDSYGPDITKFKYTGQEEDQESGLYYYKARYYDASLGRFASNDGMVFPDKEQGMNRMMYVEGNPMRWADRSGNRISQSWAFAAVAYFFVKDNSSFGNDIAKLAFIYQAFKKGRANDRNSRHAFQNWDVSKSLDGLRKVNFEKFTLASLSFIPGGIFVSKYIDKTLNSKRKADRQDDRQYYYDSITVINCGKGGRLEGNPLCFAAINNYYEKHGFTAEGFLYNLALTAVPCGTGFNGYVNSGYTYGGWDGFVNTVIGIIQGFKFEGDKDTAGCTQNI
ncbi:RHS repeat-associated core domain-containing protein, partial [Leptospira meyeri]|uniref:RHS repeat-associated core domain-containing protein n=1 Tax=Leptospira meyeri TaxID=29508 RepID=UPI001FB01DA1